MSRLDQHVSAVRTRLAFGVFLRASAWTVPAYAALVFLAVIAYRFGPFELPVLGWRWLVGGLIVSIALAVAYTIKHWPTRHHAAVAIDQAMGLNEKFSTALYARSSTDPFAAAAVYDAETTAGRVILKTPAPRVPPLLWGAPGLAVLIILTIAMFGARPVAEADAARLLAQAQPVKVQQDAKRLLEQAMAKIDAMPETPATETKIQQAREEIKGLLTKPIRDPAAAQRTAMSKMAEMETIKQKIKDTEKFADAQNELKAFKSMPMPADPNSPIGKVQESIGKGEFSKAVDELKDVANNFDKMKEEDKKKAAEEMQQLAKNMKKAGQDDQQQQKLKDDLQKMGASKNQLDQLSKAVQAAAGGDKQAQQQVQQLANQIAQNINQNGGMSQQQQQQISQQVQQQVKQMQGAANSQAAAQQMAGAAQQMANAMQQAAQGQNGQATAKPGTQQQPATGTQSKGQQPSQQQSMADAQAQMQQQLDQLQQTADDAASIAQGQQSDGTDGSNGQQGDGDEGGGDQAQAKGGGQGQGNGGQGNPGGPPGGGQRGEGGVGGLRPKGSEAGFATKREVAPGKVNKDGKLLASTFVKSLSQPGKSKAQAVETIESEEKDATDEVDQDRISRPAQGAVKRHFDEVKGNPQP